MFLADADAEAEVETHSKRDVAREHIDSYLRDHSLHSEQSQIINDPLDDVIDWLGYADLGEVLAGDADAFSACSDGGTMAALPPASLRTPWSKQLGLCDRDRAGDKDPRTLTSVEPEEKEWDARQQQTGATGRLVMYDKWDHPREDVLLRGGSGKRVVVLAVTECGRAQQAGVKAGDILVSIDGKKDFRNKSADAIHEGLRSPVTLVFMGFVGKLQAEVRLNYKQKICGLSSHHQVVVGTSASPVKVAEEVIFQPGSATLFLATMPNAMANTARSASSTDTGGAGSEEDASIAEEYGGASPSSGSAARCAAVPGADELSAVYELRGYEARSLVSRALSRAHSTIPSSRTLVHSELEAPHAAKAQLPPKSRDTPATSGFSKPRPCNPDTRVPMPTKPVHFFSLARGAAGDTAIPDPGSSAGNAGGAMKGRGFPYCDSEQCWAFNAVS